ATPSVLFDCLVQTRNMIIVTALLIAVHIALLFKRRNDIAEGKETSPVRIGIVLDVGGRGDKSFNDGAYAGADRKSTRLNSSHEWISYAVFCLKKKKKTNTYKNA